MYVCIYVQIITAVFMCVLLNTSIEVLLLGVTETAMLLSILLCSEGCKANGKIVMLYVRVSVTDLEFSQGVRANSIHTHTRTLKCMRVWQRQRRSTVPNKTNA